MKFSSYIKNQFSKKAFVAADALKQAAAQPPMDPSMMQGDVAPMQPPMPAGGDPNMMPPPPMDPSMTQGGESQPSGPSSDEIVNMLEEFSEAMKRFEQDVDSLKQEVSSMKIQFAESMTTVNNVLDILNKGQIQTPKAPMAQ